MENGDVLDIMGTRKGVNRGNLENFFDHWLHNPTYRGYVSETKTICSPPMTKKEE